MLNFGFIGGAGAPCPRPDDEYLFNYSFDCGKLGWNYELIYPAVITDNGDGSLHLKTDSDFGSLVPNTIPHDNQSWIIEVSIRN